MTAKMPKRIYRLIIALTGCVIIECVALIQVFSAGSDYSLLPTLKPKGFESLFGKMKAPKKGCFHFWRRARDSNPRNSVDCLHDFQSCSFGQLGQLSK